MRRLSQFILFTFLLFGLSYLVLFSPLFAIQGIDVRGTTIPKADILEVSGAKLGQNLLFYRAETGSRELLKDARFRGVTITKQWPNHLIIDLDARQPFVSIYDNGNTITLDSTGLVIEINQPNESLIQMRGFSISQASLGEAIASPEAATMKKALDLANLISQTNLKQTLITYENAHIVLRLGESWTIKFGSANQIEDQFSVFKAMYDQLVDQGTTGGTIDVTNAAIAVFKPFE